MGFILTIYFILEGDHAYRWFLSFFPPPSRGRLDLTLQRAEVRMGKWLLGQLGVELRHLLHPPYLVAIELDSEMPGNAAPDSPRQIAVVHEHSRGIAAVSERGA